MPLAARRLPHRRLAGLLLLLPSAVFAGGQFLATGDLTSPRALHAAALLGDGRVLVVGGIADFGVPVASAELYDPSSGAFSVTAAPAETRMGPTMVSLADGRALVFGGRGGDHGGMVFPSAEIYDPASGQFSAAGNTTTPRYVASTVLLADGRVLIAGGFNFADGPLSSAEIYDPATAQFTATGSLAEARTAGNAIVRLADGRVLIAGGSNEAGPLSSAEVYDPSSATFAPTGALPESREEHSMVRLDDGSVLVVGGSDGGASGGFPLYRATALRYDPASGVFAPSGSLAFPRDNQSASLLPDGRVLVAGGSRLAGEPGSTTVAMAEIYDPASGAFSAAGDMATPRYDTRAITLADRHILFAGGWAWGGDTVGDVPTASAELFTPPAPADAIFADGFEAAAAAVSDYDDLAEGDLGSAFTYGGIAYHDANGIGGVFPDGSTFTAQDVGDRFIVEDASVFYVDFPAFGSPPNTLTFGTAWVPGPNVSLGPLVRATLDLDQPASAASLDLAYYENGPWGGIQFHLDALDAGVVVASDVLTIAGGGDRDNPAIATLAVDAAAFDTLKLYATWNGQPSAPRAMIDDLALTPAAPPR